MATITGPKVQLPSGAFIQQDGSLSIDALTFLNALQSITFYSSRSGPTASRPTSTSFRWIGMPYFDISLGAKGKPVFLAIASSNAWVLADGTAA